METSRSVSSRTKTRRTSSTRDLSSGPRNSSGIGRRPAGSCRSPRHGLQVGLAGGSEATQQQLAARPQFLLPVRSHLVQVGTAEHAAHPAQQSLGLFQSHIDDTGQELDRLGPPIGARSRTALC